jgi:hypothetical protein
VRKRSTKQHHFHWQVIGNWLPPNNLDEFSEHNLINAELGDRLHKLGFAWDHIAVRPRGQDYNGSYSQNPVTKWHHDGGGKPMLMVLWASHNHTWLRAKPDPRLPAHYRGKKSDFHWEARCGDIVLINNAMVQHKHPPFISPKRLFARAWDVRSK